MKTILIPTDFSEVSKSALKEGVSLLQATGVEGKVLLLNTYLLPSSSPHPLISLHDQLKKDSTKKLKEEVNQIKKEISSDKISFETLSYIGSPESVIAHLAQERKIDYVVLGINGDPKDEVIKILKRLSSPVLIIPHPYFSSKKS